MSQTDFSEDITNGGAFGSEDTMAVNGTETKPVRKPEALESSGGGDGDTGSAAQYGNFERTLFVGGLSWGVRARDLRDYFTKYGGIESLTLKGTDYTRGRRSGFAFIVFIDGQTIEKVLAAGEHLINGKKVVPKRGKARRGQIFVGGLYAKISDEDIKAYFAQFGKVAKVERPMDNKKRSKRGFCFVTFDNEQVVDELLKNPKQVIGGKEVDVKKAFPGMRPEREDWRRWGGAGYGTGYPYPIYSGAAGYGGYGDYYGGGGYGSSYAYDRNGGYGAYDGGYGYEAAYDGGSWTRGSSRGRGFGGKQRGAPRGQQRYWTY